MKVINPDGIVKPASKCTAFVTLPGKIAVFRPLRDRALDGHTCAFTYLEVSGLAAREMLVEIEGEAVKE